MYLRHTIRKKDGKVHRYWCLVRSVRVGRRVIQQTVAQLGELDERGRLQARLLVASDRRSRASAAVRRRLPRCDGAGTSEGYPARAFAPVWRRISRAGPMAAHRSIAPVLGRTNRTQRACWLGKDLRGAGGSTAVRALERAA